MIITLIIPIIIIIKIFITLAMGTGDIKPHLDKTNCAVWAVN